MIISNEVIETTKGLAGLALSPISFNGNRYLALRPLASFSMFYAKTKDLLNYHKYIDYCIAPNVLSSQASQSMVFSQDGILFFAPTRETAIGCIDIHDSVEEQQNYVSKGCIELAV